MAGPLLCTCFYFNCDPNQKSGFRHHLSLEWSSQDPNTVDEATPKTLSSSKLNLFLEWEILMLYEDKFITLQNMHL